MTQLIEGLDEIADQFDAIVLDQWGVLHDGTTPYPGAIAALERLCARNVRLAVLSNSGKRSDLNAMRIATKGFASSLFETVMTSGEALYRDMAEGRIAGHRAFAITADATDAHQWAEGLNLSFADQISDAEMVIVMGLPEGDAAPSTDQIARWRDAVLDRGLPVYCSNPDRTSPRAGGILVTSPGALAHDMLDAGANVTFYGKPYVPVYRAIEAAMDVSGPRVLMVGDSLEHDISGAQTAGWKAAFVRGGIHAKAFITDEGDRGGGRFDRKAPEDVPATADTPVAVSFDDITGTIDALAVKAACAPPDYSLPTLR